jgi:hypothetical protein
MEKSKSIHDYVDLQAIRELLVEYPQLCILFEVLCLHIDSIIQLK